eukprot:GHVU01169835.1.p1 GENE.GHVU01169835.1~~GHVU01169835.1.p1  ORF type:complete len:155 (+),score=7.96 GHVU01169835.1:172-636(+)
MRHSGMWSDFEAGQMPEIVVGDSGYMCTRWLLTPYNLPTTTAGQTEYNDRLCAGRVGIECAFGRWKRKFAILRTQVRCAHDFIPYLICASAILYNIIRTHNIRGRVYGDFPDHRPPETRQRAGGTSDAKRKKHEKKHEKSMTTHQKKGGSITYT